MPVKPEEAKARRRTVLRMALKLHAVYAKKNKVYPWATFRDFHDRFTWLISRINRDNTAKQLQLLRHATSFEWMSAANIVAKMLQSEVDCIAEAAKQLSDSVLGPPTITGPSLREIVDDLNQLYREFDAVAIDLKNGTVSVETDEITLNNTDATDADGEPEKDVEITFEPFTVTLSLTAFKSSQTVDCFKIKGGGHPSTYRPATIHPHVSDGVLCAGEAMAPIAKRLERGGICDAFMLVIGVLNEYNCDAPYVHLDHWNRRPRPGEENADEDEDRPEHCDDCGRDLSDEHDHCEHCGVDLCASCIARCDSCESYFCSSHCAPTTSGGYNRCRSCTVTCPRCHRGAAKDKMVEANDYAEALADCDVDVDDAAEIDFAGHREVCEACFTAMVEDYQAEKDNHEDNYTGQLFPDTDTDTDTGTAPTGTANSGDDPGNFADTTATAATVELASTAGEDAGTV